VKIFAESPEAGNCREFSFLLVSAMGKHKLALDVWHLSIRLKEAGLGGYEDLYNGARQKYWGAAHRRIDAAEALIPEMMSQPHCRWLLD